MHVRVGFVRTLEYHRICRKVQFSDNFWTKQLVPSATVLAGYSQYFRLLIQWNYKFHESRYSLICL